MNDTTKPRIPGKSLYQPPQVVRVSLRPEEAVLGHCKVTGSAGPVTGGCGAPGMNCLSFGS